MVDYCDAATVAAGFATVVDNPVAQGSVLRPGVRAVSMYFVFRSCGCVLSNFVGLRPR